MFGGLFSTILGKIAAIVVTAGGVAGGMAATGALPSLGQADLSVAPVTAAGPAAVALPIKAGTPLSFPDLPKLHQAIIDRGAQELASTASTRAIRIASQAETNAKKAAAAAQKCLDGLTSQVNALVAGIPNITTQEQATAMVAQARTIGEKATACAKQATALGQQGVDEINKAAGQLNAAVAQIGSLNLQNTAGQVVQGAQNAVGDATKTIDKASGSAFGMFGQITDMAAALMATAMDFQNKFQANPGTVPTSQVPVPNQPAPAVPTNSFGQFGNLGGWMEFASQMSQMYGTEFEVNTSGNYNTTSDDDQRSGSRRSGS